MLNKRVLIPLVLLTTAIFAIGYGINSYFVPFKTIINTVLPDSGDTPSISDQMSDVSQMFNERGFYKSNGFTSDESEVINNFNGNLIYQIPLYNILGQSGITCDVKLTYNGSVGHQIILSTLDQYQGMGYTADKYNINSPEWIISVNGIAVQTFNFEDKLLTQPSGTNGSTNSGTSVKKLIPGYHFDDRMGTAGITNRDRISILMGDGSLITLYNDDPEHPEGYTGLYKSDNQGSHIIANVYFDPLDQSTNAFYKNRYVELMMGDGLVYMFREYKRNFRDVTTTTGIVDDHKKPQILLLERIRNQHGTSIILTYNLGNNWKGRPLLTNIGVYNQVIDFEYNQIGFGGSSINGVRLSNLFGGSFTFLFDDIVDYNVEGGKKTGVIKEIRNPLGQKTLISNESYIRTLQNVRYKLQYRNIQCDGLNRIVEYTNFLGGKRAYSYLGSLNQTIQAILGILHGTDNFKGYGRDPFYTNMITEKTDIFNTNTTKSTSTITYGFEDPSSNFSDFNIDAEDNYSTTISVVSNNSNTVNESKNLKTLYNYKVFPVKDYGFKTQEASDVQGTTKLISEEVLNTDGSAYSATNYEYDSEPYSNSVYNGSFLITKKTNIIGSASRIWDYMYKFLGNDKQEVLTEKVEVDPNDYKTQIFFKNYNQIINYWNNYYGPSGLNDTINLEGPKTFYKIELDTLIKRYDNTRPRNEYPGTLEILLSSSSKEYCLDTNQDFSYIGQLIAERQYRNGSNELPIETKYEYYKTDSLGKHLYNPARVPYIEGNIKRIIKPDNQEERYFYFPFNRGQNQLYTETDDVPGALPLPEISYKIKFNDGIEELNKSGFIDTRLPTRIDKYKRNNSTSVDSISKIYVNYNDFGKPSQIVNQNGYLTQVDYDFTYNRVIGITLPGDFSKELSRDTIYYIDKTIDTTVTLPSIAWGTIFSISNAPKQFKYSSSNQYFPQIYQMHFDNEHTDELLPFIKFDYNYLSGFNTINSATLRIAPLNYTLMTGTNSNFTIYQTGYSARIQPAYGFGTRFYDGQVFTESNPQYYNVFTNMTIPPYPVNSWTGQTSTCNFNEHINNIDVKSILEYLRSNSKNLYGFIISPLNTMNPPPEGIRMRYIMNMTSAPGCFDFEDWKSNYKPVLQIEGNYTRRDEIKQRIIGGGTFIYEYDDVNNSVKIRSRLNNNPGQFKTIRNNYDGFGNIKQKDIFTSATEYNSYQYKFNFNNQLAEEIDALNHSTKYSYDITTRNSVTKFADDSTTINNFGYTNSLGGYFGTTYNKFVEIQEFKDETKRSFYKYFDAVGNLLREMKFVSNNYTPDTPFDPDTTGNEMDDPGDIQLITDYKYDNLYRLIQVKTPAGKLINYSYDSYNRQILRGTPDDGIKRMSYDKNNNLVLTQDAKQNAIDQNLNIRRTYDALNRMLTIGDYKTPGSGGTSGQGDTLLPYEFDTPPNVDSIYIINVYDSLLSAFWNGFSSNKPSDYYSAPNFTKGKLVATAYRTRLGENWNYKFYRYDARGNAVKMWSYIDGLGWKSMTYKYNSQNQNTYFDYQPNNTDGKQFKFGYDEAGRLIESALYLGPWSPTPENDDGPNSYYNLTRYTYNANSQIATHGHNGNLSMITYTYNNRNWVNWINHSPGQIFRYVLFYNANGNIRYQDLQGSYSDNFSVSGNRRSVFIYDKSNRLLKANMILTNDSNSFDVTNSYDNDGNLLTLKRYGSNNNLVDDFSYNYYLGTNKLAKVSGTKNQYTYDNNGNLTTDDLNKNQDIMYDFRNLMTENTNKITQYTYKTKYWYDETGNRIRKQVLRFEIGGGIEGDGGVNGGDGSWVVDKDEFYLRDITGKEIAIYNGTTLQQWNIYGLDQIGHMNADTSKYFYLKDHLGSTRVVINTQNQVVSAQDYDPWGYIIENRSYQPEYIKYRFTGKERDKDFENNYDYFGARYYDSRIGRWGQVEPLLDMYLSFSPYSYIFDNPTNIVDIDGRGPGGGGADRPVPYPYDGGGWGPVGIGIGIGGAVEIAQAIKAISSAIIEIINNGITIEDILEYLITPSYNENTKEKEKSEPNKTDEKAEDKPQYPVPEIDWENDKPKGDDWNPPKNPNENWTRKNPKESLRKDKQHGPPIGPHWDWKDPGKINWRIFPDGRVLRKYPGTNK